MGQRFDGYGYISDKRKKMGYLKASKTFGVPKTTLIRLYQQKNKPLDEVTNLKLGRKAIFNERFETDLVDFILAMEASGFGLTRRDVMKIAYQLAEKNKLQHNFSHEKHSAGKTWLRLFLQRHPEVSFRRPTGTSLARLRGFNREDVNQFYTLLETVMEQNNYPASNVYNVDETGISVVPARMPEVLAKKGKRQIAATTSAERGSTVTCVMCMSASGTYVPPMMIFPRKRDHPLLMKGAPPGAIHACHPSGWIQTELFTKWFQHFINHVKPSATSPVLLILDGHVSHTRNIDLIVLARANNVQLLSLPPHSSHKIQPLDRTFMGPFKKYFAEEIRQWMRNKVQAATHYDIAEIFGRAYIKSQRADLAINGFRTTGIYPIDRTVFQDHDFIDIESSSEIPPINVQLQQAPSNLPFQTQPMSVAPEDNNEDNDSDRTSVGEADINVPIVNLPQSSVNDEMAVATEETRDPFQITGVNQILTLVQLSIAATSELFVGDHKSPEYKPITPNAILNFANESDIAGPSASTSYLSPKQLFPVPNIRKKSSNRGRKATKSTFLTSSPYKLDLETTISKKHAVEALKKEKNITKLLDGTKNKRKGKRTASERKQENKKQQTKKATEKKRKTTKKIVVSSSSEGSDFSVNDDTDESPDRSTNAKCFYCNGLFSEDMRGEQWIQCPSCNRWAHEECAGVDDNTNYICEYCRSG